MTLSDVQDFYQKIIPLNYIVRYSNVPRIKDETVAAHSFLVAAIVVKLYQIYDFDLGHALLMAICHDMPEFEVNDVTHGTKKKYPKVAEALREAELHALRDMPSEVKEVYEEFEACESVEAMIVTLADILQCTQYAENEVKLGNGGYMAEIVKTSRKRAAVLKDMLEDRKLE